MLTHKQKLSLAKNRGMQTKEERSTRNRTQAVGHGMMISRLFSTAGWSAHKHGIENKIKKSGKASEPTEVVQEVLDKPLPQE